MAENKKGFVLYADLHLMIEQLPNEKAGELFKIILRYVNDFNPPVEDLLLKVAFEPIKQQLKRDLAKYETKKKQWSEAGKKSAEKRSTESTDVERRSTVSTVTVKGRVKDTGKVIDIKEEIRSNVFLHRKEIEKLSVDYTEQDREWMYDKLSSYKLANGKTYKSDYGAILTWVTRSLSEFKKEKSNGKSTGFTNAVANY